MVWYFFKMNIAFSNIHQNWLFSYVFLFGTFAKINFMPNTRVLIFDDNKRIRESLQYLFENTDGIEVCGAFAHCREVEKVLAENKPDVVLMDIDMPEITGIEAVKRIRKGNSSISILMLTVFDDDEKVMEAIMAGASGYILKNKSLDRLVEAVRELEGGGAPMTPSIARRVLELFKEQKIAEVAEKEDFNLTKREMEVLSGLVKGASYKMVADQLHVSYDTIHSHIRNIYKKLQVNSMSEAVAKAMRNKLVGMFL